MPVRFLGGGGGGGGGGSTDVRTIIANPTLTTVTATTETTTCVWTIPANYLLAKDAIYINLIGSTALSTQANKPIYRIRIGSTGTITDSLLFTTILEGAAAYPTTAATVSIEQLIYFNSVGSSGNCVSNGRVDNYNSYENYTICNVPEQKTVTTVNTTAPLYISVSVFFSASNTFTPEVPFISFSL